MWMTSRDILLALLMSGLETWRSEWWLTRAVGSYMILDVLFSLMTGAIPLP